LKGGKMSIIKHYINEIGLNIVLDCGVDVSSATVAKIEVSLPDTTVTEWDATVWTLDDASNYLLHTTVDSDLIQVGVYKVQAYVQTINDADEVVWEALGETATFNIYDKFK
jgi:hypothetical protein